ncbi:MAG: hypothetical protein AAFO29_20690 [Actinomycetota bacterium]
MVVQLLRRNLTGFVRAFRSGAGERPGRHRGHALARTLKHGTTLCGGNAVMNFGNVAAQRREDLMVDAAERYDASFDKK